MSEGTTTTTSTTTASANGTRPVGYDVIAAMNYLAQEQLKPEAIPQDTMTEDDAIAIMAAFGEMGVAEQDHSDELPANTPDASDNVPKAYVPDVVPMISANIPLPKCAILDDKKYVVLEWVPFLTLVDPNMRTGPFEWVLTGPGMNQKALDFALRAQENWLKQDKYDIENPTKKNKNFNHDHVIDYSLVVFVQSGKDVIIKCVRHNVVFEQAPNNHERVGKPANGCKICSFNPLTQIRILHAKYEGKYLYYSCPNTIKSSKDIIILSCTLHPEFGPFGLALENHVGGGSGCPQCGGGKIKQSNTTRKKNVENNITFFTEHANIAHELIPGQPGVDEKLAPVSNLMLWWSCGKFDHPPYQKTVYNRTLGKQGCPMCNNAVASPERNFGTQPDANEWWDHEKNGHITPEMLQPGSGIKYWFLCTTCTDNDGNHVRHSYESTLYSFSQGTRCPYFAGKEVDHTNSFATYCPIISTFWDKELNGDTTPDTIAYGSGVVCYFKCDTCNHCWKSTPNIMKMQYGDGGFCVKCESERYQKARIEWLALKLPILPIECRTPPQGVKQSKMAIQWLDTINGDIMHAGNVGEYRIPGTRYSVDGFDSNTSPPTIYEFHGTFWHGHPDFYPADKQHPCGDKTFGELYAATLARENHLRELGYNLVVVWEHEIRPIKRIDGNWSIPR